MERQKCPLTLKEFSGGPSGGREEVASIKHGGRTQARVGDEKQGGLRELYPAEVRAFMRPFTRYTSICACAGLGVGSRPALLGLPRATPSQYGLQKPLVVQRKSQGWESSQKASQSS